MKGLFILLLFFILNPSALWAAEPIEIQVEGLEGEELKNVRAALALPPGLVRDGKIDERLLEHFKRRIPEKTREALQPYGYYDSRVTVQEERTAEGERIRVGVERGEPVRVAGVRVEVRGAGEKEASLRELVSAFALKEGDVLNQVRYENQKGDLKAKAEELGYLDAHFPVHQIRISLPERRAEIELILETGAQYRFGELRISGAPDYPRDFLRRYVAFQPGEVFSYTKIGQTQLNLMNADRFREAMIIPLKEEARDLGIPVEVRLAALPSRRLRPGIGYGTDTGLRFSLNYKDVNVFHRGHEWETDLSLAERRRVLSTRYIFPSYKDLESYYSLRAGAQQELLTTYESRLITAEAERARGFGKGRLGSLYLQVRREDFSVGDETGRSLLVMPGIRFSQRRYDNLIRPRRGYHYALETRGTHQALGSDTGFLQGLASADVLMPLPYRFSLFVRLQAGATAQNQPLANLPPTIRFFAGGDRSVRGFSYQSLGPKDSTGKVVGGRHLLVGSIELERAVGENWGIAVFYDAGNAFDAFDSMRLYDAAGVGVRYYTRVGPIRVDVARPLNVENPSFRLHVTVGFEL